MCSGHLIYYISNTHIWCFHHSVLRNVVKKGTTEFNMRGLVFYINCFYSFFLILKIKIILYTIYYMIWIWHYKEMKHQNQPIILIYLFWSMPENLSRLFKTLNTIEIYLFWSMSENLSVFSVCLFFLGFPKHSIQ